jgi:hypothetical protein
MLTFMTGCFLKGFFVGLPHLATCIFFVFFSRNEPELGTGFDLGMAINVDHFHLVFWTRFEPTTRGCFFRNGFNGLKISFRNLHTFANPHTNYINC